MALLPSTSVPVNFSVLALLGSAGHAMGLSITMRYTGNIRIFCSGKNLLPEN